MSSLLVYLTESTNSVIITVLTHSFIRRMRLYPHRKRIFAYKRAAPNNEQRLNLIEYARTYVYGMIAIYADHAVCFVLLARVVCPLKYRFCVS